MLQIKVFGTTPPCANCKRAEREARKAAEKFPGQVEVVHLDALGPEAQQYGLMVTPVGRRRRGGGRHRQGHAGAQTRSHHRKSTQT